MKGRKALVPGQWMQVFSGFCSFCLWAALGVFMLAVSWALFWNTGTASFEQLSLRKEDQRVYFDEKAGGLISEKEAGRADFKEESGETVTAQEQKDVWSREIFGVEIRLQDGKIVFFREKKENIY